MGVNLNSRSVVTMAYKTHGNDGIDPSLPYSMMERLALALGVPVQEIIDAETAYKEEKTA